MQKSVRYWGAWPFRQLCTMTLSFYTISARSAVYTMNNSGSSTDPCGTEQTMQIMEDVDPLNMTRNVLVTGTTLARCHANRTVAQVGVVIARDRRCRRQH